MRKYEKYKPSGIEWLGEIPEHWESFRFIDYVFLKHGYQFRDFDFTDEGVKVIKITQLNQDGNLDLENCSFIDSSRLIEFNSLKIKEGDILMALTGGTIGKIIRVNKVKEPLLQNYRVGNFFPNKKYINKTFLFHLLSSQITFEQINYLLNRNGQPNIGKESFKNMFFPLPNLSEQSAIANYLDTKTAAIDRKIELLTAKVDKYKALRRSLINETVCRGLNPNAPLKDSGIEWIGMIPEHWDEYRMKDLGFLYSGLSGKAGDDFNQDENENNCDFIPFTNIFNNDIINPEMMGKVVVFDNEKQNKVKRNDLFFLMSSEDYDGLGKSSLLAVDLKNTYLNSFCKGFRITRKKVLPAFLNYQLQSDTFRKIMQIEGKGFTRMNLKMEKVNDFTIYIPDSIEEQATIVKYLNERNAQIDTILTNISEQITKLTQLRKTLINDVVTGKIKVTD